MITFQAKVYGARKAANGERLYLELADVGEACRYAAVDVEDLDTEFAPMQTSTFQVIGIQVFRNSQQPTLQVRLLKSQEPKSAVAAGR